jgi:carbon-monoxide dehydrogenase medium subunit
MRLKNVLRPKSLDEARAVLKRHAPDAIPVAGGTTCAFLQGSREWIGVDILRLGLDGIRRVNGHFAIGATTPICDLQKRRESGWVLDRVARNFVNQQIRNVSTLGGSIVRVYPWADFPVALLALGADMALRAEPDRVVGSDEFFQAQPVRLLQPGDLLAEVRVAARSDGQGFGYRKCTRAASDFSHFTAAAWLEQKDGAIVRARVAVGAALPFPRRLQGIESLLVGMRGHPGEFARAVAGEADAVPWTGGADRSREYIRQVAAVSLVDCLEDAWREAKGESP